MWFRKKKTNPTDDSIAFEETYSKQPRHIRKLIDAMATIQHDAVTTANAVKSGQLPYPVDGPVGMVPIRVADSEKLFVRTDQNGKETFLTYHYSDDMKSMSLQAQIQLSQLYGSVYALNTLVTSSDPALKKQALSAAPAMIDNILIQSAFFNGFFRGFDLSSKLLVKQIPDDLVRPAIARHVEEAMELVRNARLEMFEPGNYKSYLPQDIPQLMIEMGAAREEGQKVINGVHFGRKVGETLLAHHTATMAQALSSHSSTSSISA